MKTHEDFLKHYGVRGMKWGVRRDRSSAGVRRAVATNQDRALQPTNPTISPKVAGEHHLSKKLAAKVISPKPMSEDAALFIELTSKARSHGISSLSNAELKKFNERFDMEKKFAKLEEEQRKKKDTRTRKLVNKVIDQMAERAVTAVAGHVVDAHVQKFVKGKAVAKVLPKP